jgi:hypothetical protein
MNIVAVAPSERCRCSASQVPAHLSGKSRVQVSAAPCQRLVTEGVSRRSRRSADDDVSERSRPNWSAGAIRTPSAHTEPSQAAVQPQSRPMSSATRPLGSTTSSSGPSRLPSGESAHVHRAPQPYGTRAPAHKSTVADSTTRPFLGWFLTTIRSSFPFVRPPRRLQVRGLRPHLRPRASPRPLVRGPRRARAAPARCRGGEMPGRQAIGQPRAGAARGRTATPPADRRMPLARVSAFGGGGTQLLRHER